MTKLIYPFLMLAAVGLMATFGIHIAALAGLAASFIQSSFKFVFPGIFVVWLPTILAFNRLSREFKQKDVWRAALRGCPKWMRSALWIVCGYGWLGSFLLPAFYGGGMNSPTNSARTMSGIAMSFYAVAACVLYSATRAEEFDQGRRCANGHRVTPLAKHCDECGSPITDGSGQSPIQQG